MPNYCISNSCGEPDLGYDCFRTTLLATMFTFTFIACILQIGRIYYNTKQLISYPVAVLVLASFETTLAVLHWTFFPQTQLNFWMIYLKELQLLVITYFFILSALVTFGKRNLVKKVLWPTFGLIILYLTSVVVLGSVLYNPDKQLACSNLTFILLSVSGLFLSTAFLINGILITRKLKQQSISDNIRKQKKLELWCLIFVYFVVSVSSSSEDVLDLILSQTSSSCSLFTNEFGETIGNLVLHTTNLLVPIWATLIVYNIEASRAKGKSLSEIQRQRIMSEDASAAPLDFDYIVGDTNFLHNQPKYYSVSSHSADYDEEA